MPTLRSSQIALGAALILLGIVHLAFGADVQRMFIVAEPDATRDALVRGLAMVLLVGGAFIAGGERGSSYVRVGAVSVAVTLLVTTAVMHLPAALASGTFGGRWIGTLKWLALASGALMFGETERTRRPIAMSARVAMAALMVASAIAHIKYTAIVVTLIPAWMPAREFWAYFTAATLAAGGIGLLVRPVARLAGMLSTLMFSGFFLLVHVPRTIAMPMQPVGWAELGESLAFAAITLALAHAVRVEKVRDRPHQPFGR